MLRNRYRPIKSLGGGGFAKTYLAEDIDKLNEKCVIKQFAPQTQGTAGLQKATELFLQEAQQLQQLGEHPQIPALLAYFEENSRLYLVQQFIDGDNLLTELEQQGIFKESKIYALLQDLLPVLKLVHSYNIIHRDIKPENIMRRRSDGKFILIDFGASKQLQGTVKTGTSIGTFGYSSLEQMQDGRVYPASDLYSIGVSCFHLLTGVHPWELWQEDGYGWVKKWRNHLQQRVSPELGKILDKLLKKDAQQRYQSAEEVLLDLIPPKIPPTAPYQHLQAPLPKPQTTPQTKSSRRGFLQTVSLLGGGFVIAVVGQNIFRNQTPIITDNPTSVNRPIPEPTTPPTLVNPPTPEPTPTSIEPEIFSKRLILNASDITTVEDTIQENQIIQYTFFGEEGAKLTAFIDQGSGILLTVLNVNQEPVETNAQEVTSYEGILPTTGRYIIQLIPQPGMAASDYSLNVAVTNPEIPQQLTPESF
ncbi:protein kinase domain-containing protein [Nodularia spumigena]|uniref:protein kinase domain-containing protein n=1 Tax=Nodularia spumigena TaxID=70799 RepID=UPI003A9127EA